jgi:hypothetical protein
MYCTIYFQFFDYLTKNDTGLSFLETHMMCFVAVFMAQHPDDLIIEQPVIIVCFLSNNICRKTLY